MENFFLFSVDMYYITVKYGENGEAPNKENGLNYH